MRYVHVLAADAVVIGVAAFLWGLSGALLVFTFSLPVLFFLFLSRRAGRIDLHETLWGLARVLAIFFGIAIGGYLLGLAVLVVVLILEFVAMSGGRRGERK